MPAPRLARLPVKQDSTPIVTGPVGRCEVVVVVVPHAARRKAAATEPANKRHRPARASVLPLLLMNRPPAQSPSWIGPRLVQPPHIVNGWTTVPLRLLDSAANGRSADRRA